MSPQEFLNFVSMGGTVKAADLFETTPRTLLCGTDGRGLIRHVFVSAAGAIEVNLLATASTTTPYASQEYAVLVSQTEADCTNDCYAPLVNADIASADFEFCSLLKAAGMHLPFSEEAFPGVTPEELQAMLHKAGKRRFVSLKPYLEEHFPSTSASVVLCTLGPNVRFRWTNTEQGWDIKVFSSDYQMAMDILERARPDVPEMETLG